MTTAEELRKLADAGVIESQILQYELRQAADRIEQLERERDEAEAKLANLHFMYDGRGIDLNTARAQVDLLAKALQSIAAMPYASDAWEIAREALKAAGV